MSIAAALTDARLRSGYTQTEAARRIGVDQSTVSYWESGKKTPQAFKLAKLADLYGCTIDELFGRGQDSA